jgi:hypothetical protein
MQSAVIRKLNEINRELELSRHGRIDPARRRYLELRKAGLERDAEALAYTPDEIKSGKIEYGNTASAESKSILAPHHSWMGQDNSDGKDQKNDYKKDKTGSDGLTNFERIRREQQAAEARYNALYSKDGNKR